MGLGSVVRRFLTRDGGVTPGPPRPWSPLDHRGHKDNCVLCAWREQMLSEIAEAEAREVVALRMQVLFAEQRADEANRLAAMNGEHVVQGTPPIMVGGKGIAWQEYPNEPFNIIKVLDFDAEGEPYLRDPEEGEADEPEGN